MSDKTLEQKSVELLDRVDNTITEFADKLGNLAEQYGPEVADAALTVARVDAASQIWSPVLFVFIVCIPMAYATYKIFKFGHDDDDDGVCVFAASLFVANIFLFAMSLVKALNIWAWVGIFEPKLWIAKQVLGL